MSAILLSPLLQQNSHQNFVPHYPSPLSSSPLYNSPPPLGSRDPNVPNACIMLTDYGNDCDILMASPKKSRRRANAISSSPSAVNDQSKDSIMYTQPALILSPPSSPSPSRKRVGKKIAFSKRPTKPNSLVDGKGDGRETRRKLFLKKVKEGRDELIWKKRMGDTAGEEEMLRVLWVEEERSRRESQRREMMEVGFDVDGEAIGEKEKEISDELMAAEVLRQEELELEALIASQPSDLAVNLDQADHDMGSDIASELPVFHHRNQYEQGSETPFGSDDDEYDHIFMDVIEAENRTASQSSHDLQQQSHIDLDDQEMMDMS